MKRAYSLAAVALMVAKLREPDGFRHADAAADMLEDIHLREKPRAPVIDAQPWLVEALDQVETRLHKEHPEGLPAQWRFVSNEIEAVAALSRKDADEHAFLVLKMVNRLLWEEFAMKLPKAWHFVPAALARLAGEQLGYGKPARKRGNGSTIAESR